MKKMLTLIIMHVSALFRKKPTPENKSGKVVPLNATTSKDGPPDDDTPPSGGDWQQTIFRASKADQKAEHMAFVKEAKVIAKDAEMVASNGVDSAAYITKVKAISESYKSLAKDGVTTSASATSAYLKTKKAELESFNPEVKAKEIEGQYAEEKRTETIAVNKQLEKTHTLHHSAELDEQKKAEKRRKNDSEEAGKDFFSKNRKAIPVLSGIVDFSFTFTAFTLHSFPPTLAVLLSISISVFIVFSVECFAEAIHRKNVTQIALWSIVGLGTLSTIILYRAGVDDNLFITASLLLLFYLGGVLVALRGIRIDSDVYQEESHKAAIELTADLAGEVVALETTLSGQDTFYATKASVEAATYKTNLKADVEGLTNTNSALVTQLSEMNDYYANMTSEGVAIVEAGIKKGEALAYTPRKASPFSKTGAAIVLGLMLVGATGCETMSPPAQYYESDVYVDVSGSTGEGTEEEAIRMTDYICDEKLNLDESYDGKRKVVVNVCKIDGYSLSETIQVILDEGDYYWVRDIPKREAEIEQFREDLLRTITQLFESARATGGTNLHRCTARGMSRLNNRSEAHHKHVFILSDFIQEGHLIQFPKYKDVEGLRENRSEIIKQLIADTSVSIDGVEITMLVQATPEQEAFSYESALIFQEIWLDHGQAADVTLMRNL